ncbi:heavy-metal-associated domain-containing protein [Micromonospora inyonensis]|uniref:Copper ion binding protein n=1 Tax=Micromonospora inyonensis TaxID=47866 RepID=A0A1C6RK05_9ACTN|nr:cation transporter [Micromonospora inyonensis]SCL17345.1 copper ion binding protein [Micromonospora inyonensis]
MATETYQVKGMTCGHCVSAVSSELGAVAGVTDVQVDLASGQVTVTSDVPLETEAVRAAVDEAGFELVGA